MCAFRLSLRKPIERKFYAGIPKSMTRYVAKFGPTFDLLQRIIIAPTRRGGAAHGVVDLVWIVPFVRRERHHKFRRIVGWPFVACPDRVSPVRTGRASNNRAKRKVGLRNNELLFAFVMRKSWST